MKNLKTIGLLAVASTALLAAVGAGTASGTVLCSTVPSEGKPPTEGTTCPENLAHPAGTKVDAVLQGSMTITTAIEDIECKKGGFEGKLTSEGSATTTVTVEKEELAFAECSCKVTVFKPGSMEIHWIVDTDDGTVTSTGTEVTTECFTVLGALHCTYNTHGTHAGTLTGGSEAILDFTAEGSRSSGGFLCDQKPVFHATYRITAPKPIYVAGHT